ncbi:MAG: hypothetical protein N2510_07315 [Ignavibacteria bacterium]|nr:hypothetical protein [Ignavibacteria bacterium]
MKYIKTLLVISILSLPFLGSDCDDVINNISTPTDISGTWNLNFSMGNLNDVCPGETVQFQSNGVAVLTCPGRSPVNRTYTVSGNTLTYTETNVKYSVTLENNNQNMTLTGINVNRVLYYSKQISASSLKPDVKDNNSFSNSSEIKKSNK